MKTIQFIIATICIVALGAGTVIFFVNRHIEEVRTYTVTSTNVEFNVYNHKPEYVTVIYADGHKSKYYLTEL